MRSAAAWNGEVRRKADDDDEVEDTHPIWTAEEGGCEGMGRIGRESESEETTVPVKEAYRKLYSYVTESRRFPAHRPEVPKNAHTTNTVLRLSR